MVSSAIIDRLVRWLCRPLVETPKALSWFVGGILDANLGFAGEESAGAASLRRDDSVWTTEKDGITPGLLAAEMTAQTMRDPGEHDETLTRTFGAPVYECIDAPATPAQKARLRAMTG